MGMGWGAKEFVHSSIAKLHKCIVYSEKYGGVLGMWDSVFQTGKVLGELVTPTTVPGMWAVAK